MLRDKTTPMSSDKIPEPPHTLMGRHEKRFESGILILLAF